MMPILKVENLSKDFVKSLDLVAKGLNKIGQNYKEEIVHAVDSVNFSIFKGEIVGVVGESGCGKSTLGRMVAGILQPTEGRVEFDTGQVKNKEIPNALLTQMIFQDPFSSLNPRKRVIDIITEAPLYHKLITKSEKRAFAAEMLQRVGLDPDTLERYPHQFSGGQRQRVGIARALAVSPEFLVCDESIAALDVSIQAQIINLFVELKIKGQFLHTSFTVCGQFASCFKVATSNFKTCLFGSTCSSLIAASSLVSTFRQAQMTPVEFRCDRYFQSIPKEPFPISFMICQPLITTDELSFEPLASIHFCLVFTGRGANT